MFTPYVIKDTDRFDPQVYPHVAEEVSGLQNSFRDIHGENKTAIVLSFLKDHCITTQWLAAHKQLVALLTSGSLPIAHVESLFVSGKGHAVFLSGLEAYISTELL